MNHLEVFDKFYNSIYNELSSNIEKDKTLNIYYLNNKFIFKITQKDNDEFLALIENKNYFLL